MSGYILGNYYEEERLENENKAFHLYFHSLSGLSQDEVYDLVSVGKWTDSFRGIVEGNLLEFIYHILPKYISCFSNAGLDGYLNIGVDDSREITGIPYIGKIPRVQIQSVIIQTLEENLEWGGGGIDREWIDRVRIECLDVGVELGLLTDEAEDSLEQYSRDIIAYNDKMEEYHNQHALFLIEHRKYSQKLETMLNITRYRLELAEYIEGEAPGDYLHLVEALRGGRFIKLRQDNFLIESERHNRNRIFYWIARFRDGKTSTNSLTNKPQKPLQTTIYHPSQILSHLPGMRYKFIQQNPDLRYYLLRIYCPRREGCEKVRFWDRFGQKWLCRKRVLGLGKWNDPSCL